MHLIHLESWVVKCYMLPPPPSSRGNMALPKFKVQEGKIRKVRVESSLTKFGTTYSSTMICMVVRHNYDCFFA
jgi:hypothetical protein